MFKNCTPVKDCRAEINGTFIDYVDFINITMPMYNLVEYSDNYSNTSRRLWAFKRDEVANNSNVTNTEANRTKNGVQIAVPLFE